MRRLALVGLVTVALSAWAGEQWLGTLTPRISSTNNRGAANDSGFPIPLTSKITVQCANPDAGSASSYVCVGIRTCSSTLGVWVTGNQALPTSTGSNGDISLDGGYKTAVVSVYSAEANNCQVWSRSGTE